MFTITGSDAFSTTTLYFLFPLFNNVLFVRYWFQYITCSIVWLPVCRLRREGPSMCTWRVSSQTSCGYARTSKRCQTREHDDDGKMEIPMSLFIFILLFQKQTIHQVSSVTISSLPLQFPTLLNGNWQFGLVSCSRGHILNLSNY